MAISLISELLCSSLVKITINFNKNNNKKKFEFLNSSLSYFRRSISGRNVSFLHDLVFRSGICHDYDVSSSSGFSPCFNCFQIWDRGRFYGSHHQHSLKKGISTSFTCFSHLSKPRLLVLDPDFRQYIVKIQSKFVDHSASKLEYCLLRHKQFIISSQSSLTSSDSWDYKKSSACLQENVGENVVCCVNDSIVSGKSKDILLAQMISVSVGDDTCGNSAIIGTNLSAGYTKSVCVGATLPAPFIRSLISAASQIDLGMTSSYFLIEDLFSTTQQNVLSSAQIAEASSITMKFFASEFKCAIRRLVWDKGKMLDNKYLWDYICLSSKENSSSYASNCLQMSGLWRNSTGHVILAADYFAIVWVLATKVCRVVLCHLRIISHSASSTSKALVLWMDYQVIAQPTLLQNSYAISGDSSVFKDIADYIGARLNAFLCTECCQKQFEGTFLQPHLYSLKTAPDLHSFGACELVWLAHALRVIEFTGFFWSCCFSVYCYNYCCTFYLWDVYFFYMIEGLVLMLFFVCQADPLSKTISLREAVRTIVV